MTMGRAQRPRRRVGMWLLLAAVVMALVAGVAMNRSATIDRVWYFDLNTRTLFPGPYAAAPPIDAPSGDYVGSGADDLDQRAGVLAMVVRAKTGGELQIVYLQRYTREARELRLRQLAGETLENAEGSRVNGGLRIALPPTRPDEPLAWRTPGSAAGKAILDRFGQVMATGQVELHLPGD